MTYHFKPADAALLLVDYQVGTLQLANTTPAYEALRNAVVLAKAANVLGIPVVLTASQEDRVQGPTHDWFSRVVPEAYESRVLRSGVIDAWQDPAFRAAVEKTGRKQLIIGAITTDICLVLPAISAHEAGYEVQAVMDASSSPYRINEDISRHRIERAGVEMTVTNTIVAELTQDWSTPEGQEIAQFLPTPYLMRPVD
ncbi:isochorismatase family protein [Stakelama pacifica]|uniref:Nicotinamidase-related amidase n=1 Tax=Stakelama pacifica TaxID=517720 RepID=A0A4R6FMK4_9SPHN|nr:isochorismatase family protein [Stakelama pacifica]TDN82809.1 nicotinamidase-related amidase [Stakelama pacifica]GGO95528.1 isochorismatase [Stakelama pacifica]